MLEWGRSKGEERRGGQANPGPTHMLQSARKSEISPITQSEIRRGTLEKRRNLSVRPFSSRQLGHSPMRGPKRSVRMAKVDANCLCEFAASIWRSGPENLAWRLTGDRRAVPIPVLNSEVPPYLYLEHGSSERDQSLLNPGRQDSPTPTCYINKFAAGLCGKGFCL